MHPMLNIAIKAAREAGHIILRYSNRVDSLTINNKSRNDFVSEVDKMAEEAILKVITRHYPEHSILAEESGTTTNNDDFQWIIDPLDGTTNYLYGIPQYAVSIALKVSGKLEVAVVYDPVKEELFTATRGNGAKLNDRRIRVSGRFDMHNALLATGIPFRDNQELEPWIDTLRILIPDTAGIRRPGAASLDLAYIAAGRFDGFWEFGLNPWDFAAGLLLIQEAGGLVGDLQGEKGYWKSGDILCGTPKVYKAMLQRLNTG